MKGIIALIALVGLGFMAYCFRDMLFGVNFH